MEGVLRVPTVGARVRKKGRDLQELEDRSGPAVRHDEGHGIRLGRAQVEEVDVEAVDFRHRGGEGVHPRLGRAPVIVVSPVFAEGLHPCERRALAPVVDRLALRPSRARQPLSQVLQRTVGEGERIWSDGVGHVRILFVGE